MIDTSIQQKLIEEYWYTKFAGATLPGLFYRRRPAGRGVSMATAILPEAVVSMVGRLGKYTRPGEYAIYLSVFSFLTAKYFRDHSLFVCSPPVVDGTGPGSGDMPLFYSLLVDTRKDLGSFIREVAVEVQESMRYGNADYGELSNRFADRGIDEERLHSICFHYEGLQGELSAEYNPVWMLSLTFAGNGELKVTLRYDHDLIEPPVANDFLKRYSELLEQLEVHLNVRIALNKIELLSTAERNQIFFSFNESPTGFPQDTLTVLWEQQVLRTPDRIALQYEETRLTYSELNMLSNRLAHYLRSSVAHYDGALVALFLDRSHDIGTAALGVLKAGCAFVAIDTQFPPLRINTILEDARPVLVIAHSDHLQLLEGYEGEVFAIDIQMQSLKEPVDNPVPVNLPGDPAYVLYTSGTTGVPKGAMISHEAMVNLVTGLNSSFLSSAGRLEMAAVASYVFDPFWKQFFLALLGGHTLHIIPERAKRDPRILWEHYSRCDIALTDGTPSLLSILLNNLPPVRLPLSLRYFMIGGESLHPEVLLRLYRFFEEREQQIDVINEYGVTECCVDSACYLVDRSVLADSAFVPIGRPLPNNQLLILDTEHRLVPVGCYGQIGILGKGVGYGYLNCPELTNEKFVNCAYPVFTGKLYLTGDLGKWLPDGTIVCAGRIDDQVKVNGHRIELKEIEAALRRIPGVREAVVIVRQRDGQNVIIAYWTGNPHLAAAAVKTALQQSLPAYMLPSYYKTLRQLPLTVNGKVNKQMLPDPWLSGDAVNGEVYAAPATDMERLLAGVWQQVMGLPEIGIRNDFFLNGGDSIKAIQIASQLHGLGFKMEVGNIFSHPTIEQLALVVKRMERMPDQQEITGEVLLTPVQHRFFGEYKFAFNHCNQSVLLKYDYHLTPEKVSAMFSVLLDHHDALRTVFKRRDSGEWVQITRGKGIKPALHIFDQRHLLHGPEELEQEADRLQRSIDLENGPLVQLGLFHMTNGSRLLVIVHHLVMDAVSFRILLEDLAALDEKYEAGVSLELPLKTDPYKAWAAMLLDYAGSTNCLKEKIFWQERLSAISQLPPYAGSSEPGKKAGKVYNTFELNAGLSALLLGRANRAFNTEVQDLLVGAVALTCRDMWSTPAIAVMLEGHGREPLAGEVNVSRTIGWFTSHFPVLIDTSTSQDLGDHLVTVKEAIREIPNKGAGYGVLRYLATDGLKQEENIPLLFNYLGQINGNMQSGAFSLARESHGSERDLEDGPDYKLEITAIIIEGQLHMGVASREVHEGTPLPAVFSTRLQSRLEELIRFAAAVEVPVLTPADLTFKKLSRNELAEICSRYDVQDIYPLSPMQEGILFSCLYRDDAPAYIQQLSYRVSDPGIRPELVRSSIGHLIARHDILRTVFLFENTKRPLQAVLKRQEPECVFEDLRGRDDQEGYIMHFKQQDRARAFDLKNDVMLRVAIFQLREDEYEFVWTHHHLLMDAWCEGILIREYYRIYNSLAGGLDLDLPPAMPYSTYIKWLEEQEGELVDIYWSDYLEAFEKNTPAPFRSGAQLPLKETAGTFEQLKLDNETTTAINELAARLKVTVNTIMQAIWAILIGRYNNTRDVVFGCAVSGRPAEIPGVDQIVGLFINTIPVRVRFSSGASFAQLVREVQREALEREPYQYKSLSEIQRISGHSSLIDHILFYDNYPATEDQLGSSGQPERTALPAIYDAHIHEKPHYDLNVRVTPGNSLRIRIEYNSASYLGQGIASMLLQFEHIISTILKDPDVLIGDMNIMPEAERIRLDAFSRGDSMEYGAGDLVERFEKVAFAMPRSTAVIYKDKQITYEALNKMVSAFAAHLQDDHKVTTGDIVGIMLERKDLAMAAILGVMKSGAAFLPVDTALPAERKRFIFSDAGVRLLITTSDCLFSLGECYSGDLMAADLLELSTGEGLLSRLKPDKDRLAYVLYTSGSTGTPKGVRINMSSLVNYIEWANAYYFDNSTGHCFGLFTSLSFDLSLTALFSGILRGDKVVLFDNEIPAAELLAYLFEEQDEVNTIKITPSHVTLLERMPLRRCAIQTVILGGEQVCERHIEILHRLNPLIRVFNEYGPTETTVGCTVKEVRSREDMAVIGRPISNVQVYVLNEFADPQPVGAVGEIFVGGAGVGNGYLNRESLTEERFVDDPSGNGRKLYRTGDLGRWTEHGELIYSGRIDDQLKIRGYRIEPAEIENAVMQYPGITAVVVLAVQDGDANVDLACYYSSEVPQPSAGIKQHLAARLPAHMIPAHYIHLAAFPLNTNGKIDRRDLPAPGSVRGVDSELYVLPDNTIEQALQEIWKEVLGTDGIGVCDNFFALGGNSLKIVRLYSLIQQAFNVQVKISSLFDNPTIRQQAGIIGLNTGKDPESIAPIAVLDF